MKNKKHPLHFIKPGFSFKKGGAVPCHKCMKSRQEGGSNVITSPMGQWAYPGQVTRIPSNQITMKGVNYPVLGVDNTGYKQMMMPGGEYAYPGTSVTEYPMMQNGGHTVWTVPANETSHYDPLGDIVYMSEKDKYNPMVYPHEMYHRSQFLSGMGSIPGFWNGPLRKPQTPSVDPEDLGQLYYNRRAIDQDILTNDFLNAYPEFQFVSPEVVYNRAINPDMYDTPWTLEGEADNYSNQFAGPMYYEKRGGRVKAQIGKFIPPPGYDMGVQRNDATTVNRTVIDPKEVAKAKQEALEARAKEIASGRGSENFLGMFNVPVDYSGIERQNASTLAQKKLAAEKAQGKVYNNLVEAAFMAAGPVSDIIGVAKTAAPQITANRALFDPGSQRAITTTTPKLLPSPTTLPNTGESLGSVDDVISASGKYRTRLGANEATNVYEGNWYWNTDYPAATLHDLNTGVSPEWFYNRSFSNQIDRFKRAMSQPGLSQGEKVLPNSKNLITSTPVTNPSTGQVFYNPSSLAKSGALQFKGPMMKFDPISKTVTDPTLKLYDYYPEAVKFPGSEVREMMPVSAGTLYDQYYLPFKMGGSKKSRKSRR